MTTTTTPATVTLKVTITKPSRLGTESWWWSVYDENGRCLVNEECALFRFEARWAARRWCRKYAKGLKAHRSETWTYTAEVRP